MSKLLVFIWIVTVKHIIVLLSILIISSFIHHSWFYDCLESSANQLTVIVIILAHTKFHK